MASGMFVAVALAVLVAISVGAVIVARGRAPARTDRSSADDEPLELEAALESAYAEAVDQRDQMIESRLDVVIGRGVPVRRLEAVPELRTVRLCFADGTRLFGKGANPGDLGVLGMMLRNHVVCPTRARRDLAGNHLILSVQGRRDPVEVVITGLDQPD